MSCHGQTCAPLHSQAAFLAGSCPLAWRGAGRREHNVRKESDIVGAGEGLLHLRSWHEGREEAVEPLRGEHKAGDAKLVDLLHLWGHKVHLCNGMGAGNS